MKKIFRFKFLFIYFLLLSFNFSFAQSDSGSLLNNAERLVDKAGGIVSTGVVNLMMGIVFVVFLLSIITFLWRRRSGDDRGIQDAKNMLGWSIIAMFVMVSIWGLVQFIGNNLNIGWGGSAAKPDPLPREKITSKKSKGQSCNTNDECISNKCSDSVGSLSGGVCD